MPSPFQVVESVPMYRLRRYFPPDNRNGQTPLGPPVLMVHPMMMSADMWDVTREDGAVGILHQAGLDPWVIDFGSPDRIEGGMERTLADHIVAVSEAIDTVKKATGQDVHLAGYSQGGMWAYQTAGYRRSTRPRQHHRFRLARRHACGVADGSAAQPCACRRGVHGRPRVQPHRHPELVGAHGLSDAGPAQDRESACRLPPAAA